MKRRVRWALSAVAVAVVATAIVFPRLHRSHIVAQNEQSAVRTLQMLGSMANSMRMAGSINRDKDHRGEWLPLSKLVEFFGGRLGEMKPCGWVQGNGYFFQLYLPDGRGGALDEAGMSALSDEDMDPRMIDEQEYHYCCYAWPVEYGKTGRKTFFVNREAWVLACEPDATIYDGTKSFPKADAAFVDNVFGEAAIGKQGIDGNMWADPFDREGSGLDGSSGILVFDAEGKLVSEVRLEQSISVQYWYGMGAESKACFVADKDGSIYALVPGYQGVLPPPHECVYQRGRKYRVCKFDPKGKVLWEKIIDLPENVLFEGQFRLLDEGIQIAVNKRDDSHVVIAVDREGREARIVADRRRKAKERPVECRTDDAILSLERGDEGDIFLVKSSTSGKEIWKRAIIQLNWFQRGHGGPFGCLWMGADGKSYIHSDIGYEEHLGQLERFGREP